MDRIDLLRAYVAVAEAGSFTAAAQRMDVTPQLVSKYVRALEDQLDAQLFTRSTRSVRLTETGSAYLSRCVQLLEDFDELSAAVREDHRAPQGTLTVSAPTTYGELYIADAIAEFALTFPDVQVDLRLTDRYVSLVEDGFDVAIRIGMLEDSSYIARKLATSDLVFCASPKYLDAHGAPQTPSDLRDHSCLIDSNFRHGGNWFFSEPNGAARVDVKGRLRVNSASAIRKFALKDAGIAFCPAFVVADDLKAGRLVSVLGEFQPESLGVYAVYLENRHLSAKIRVFVDFMSKALR